ncbi:MAG TPA: thioredoxin domain-containing protein [Gemmatimonadaceae bacterium]|nr:thioredoxin domain-containing protein [Gemmatimonadaceae bacterium]
MPSILLRSLAACAFLVACSRPAATPRTTDTAGARQSASADGSLASSTMPHDSITDLADRGRIAGDPSATVWVLMASDFQCPYCKEWHDASFLPLMRDYAQKGKIRLAFVNMPLSIHPNAIPAAEAAMCASVQNKFWPAHDALFASQPQWESMPKPIAKLDSVIAGTGVDMAQWRSCMAKHATLPLIQADHDKLHNAGVNSTPTFFVDGKMLTNDQGLSAGVAADVRGAIEAALKAKAKP